MAPISFSFCQGASVPESPFNTLFSQIGVSDTPASTQHSAPQASLSPSDELKKLLGVCEAFLEKISAYNAYFFGHFSFLPYDPEFWQKSVAWLQQIDKCMASFSSSDAPLSKKDLDLLLELVHLRQKIFAQLNDLFQHTVSLVSRIGIFNNLLQTCVTNNKAAVLNSWKQCPEDIQYKIRLQYLRCHFPPLSEIPKSDLIHETELNMPIAFLQQCIDSLLSWHKSVRQNITDVSSKLVHWERDSPALLQQQAVPISLVRKYTICDASQIQNTLNILGLAVHQRIDSQAALKRVTSNISVVDDTGSFVLVPAQARLLQHMYFLQIQWPDQSVQAQNLKALKRLFVEVAITSLRSAVLSHDKNSLCATLDRLQGFSLEDVGESPNVAIHTLAEYFYSALHTCYLTHRKDQAVDYNDPQPAHDFGRVQFRLEASPPIDPGYLLYAIDCVEKQCLKTWNIMAHPIKEEGI